MFELSFHVTVLIRIICAVVFGFGIGLERELTNKYAGLRTHILVCLGSCIFTILSIYAFPTAVDQTNPQAYGDPARIAAQILTGIGFIGGGTVLRHGNSVSGLTTAATLWVAAGIGMACGCGETIIALIATIFSVGVLVFVRFFEINVLKHSEKSMKRIKITTQCSSEKAEGVHNYILENFTYINEISKKINPEDDNQTTITAIIDTNIRTQIQNLYKDFQKIKGLDAISIQEANE